MTARTWVELSRLASRLGAVADEVPSLPRPLRRRIDALVRAVSGRDLAALASFDASRPPPTVDAWWDERATAADLPEVALWVTENAAHQLARGETPRLQPVTLAIEEWAKAASVRG